MSSLGPAEIILLLLCLAFVAAVIVGVMAGFMRARHKK